MAATCFPYGFPTSRSRVNPTLGPPWLRCINAEPGTFGHECDKPAAYIGTMAATTAPACFGADCKARGHEAPGFAAWHTLDLARDGSC